MAASRAVLIRRTSTWPLRRCTGPASVSGIRTWPTTVTRPVGAAGTCGSVVVSAALPGGSQPRSTSTAVPLLNRSGMTIS